MGFFEGFFQLMYKAAAMHLQLDPFNLFVIWPHRALGLLYFGYDETSWRTIVALIFWALLHGVFLAYTFWLMRAKWVDVVEEANLSIIYRLVIAFLLIG